MAEEIKNSTLNTGMADTDEVLSGRTINGQLTDDGIAGAAYSESELNAIREKTFSRDLKDLVDKVTTHEPKKINEDPVTKAGSEHDLILKFHELFYRSAALIGLEGINRSFSPYMIDGGSIHDSLLGHISRSMAEMRMPGFAILSYDFYKRCYLPAINNISEIDEKNLLIDISEKFYSRLISEKTGFILDYDTMTRDLFIKKRFNPEGGNPAYLYFISFKHIVPEVEDLPSAESGDDELFSILIVIGNGSGIFVRPEDIYKRIKGRLSLHMILFDNLIRGKSSIRGGDIRRSLPVLEYFFSQYSRSVDNIIYIIKCRDYNNINLYYVFCYLCIKLRKSLLDGSVVCHTGRDTIIIFTGIDKTPVIKAVIDRYNMLYSDYFSMIPFEFTERNSFSALMRDYLIF